MTVLTRDFLPQLKELDDRTIEAVEVPEWSVNGEPLTVYVRGLSGTDRDEFDMSMIEERRDSKGRRSQELNYSNLRARLVVRAVVDSDNPATAQLVFTPADIPWLGTKSAQGLQRVFAVAQRLSGLGNDDIEELTKELGKAPTDGSGTPSLLTSDTEASQTPSEQ